MAAPPLTRQSNVVVPDFAVTDFAPAVPGEINFIEELLIILVVTGFIQKGDYVLFGFIESNRSGELFPGAIGVFTAGKLTRSSVYHQAVILALSPFHNAVYL